MSWPGTLRLGEAVASPGRVSGSYSAESSARIA